MENRVVFGLRGLTNTYSWSDNKTQKSLRDINIRHDRSGSYPHSQMDYPEEEKLTDAARQPLEFPWKVIDVKLPPSEMAHSSGENAEMFG